MNKHYKEAGIISLAECLYVVKKHLVFKWKHQKKYLYVPILALIQYRKYRYWFWNEYQLLKNGSNYYIRQFEL